MFKATDCTYDILSVGQKVELSDIDLCIFRKEIDEGTAQIPTLYVIVPYDGDIPEEIIEEIKRGLNINEEYFSKDNSLYAKVSLPYSEESIKVQPHIVHPENISEWYFTYAESVLFLSEWNMYQSQWEAFSNPSKWEREYFYSNLIAAVKNRCST